MKRRFRFGRHGGERELLVECYDNVGNRGLHVYTLGGVGTISLSLPGLYYSARVNLRYGDAVPSRAQMVLAWGPFQFRFDTGRS